jgi:DNA helicase-2/ATP-dependent DNA helicase PcrA
VSEPEHLQRLNPEQYRAVTTVNGPLLILAGAGSGKTRVLTRRIAHMLHLGVDPENILAVTFTNKAASEMKERVQEMVGEGAKKAWVSTFHSTCGRILRMDIEALGYTRRFAIYDDDDQRRTLRQILIDLGLDITRTTPKDALSAIDQWKNKMLTVDEVVKQRRSHINDPLVQAWRVYEEQLKASDAVDFNDLIGLVVKLFAEHEEIRDKWRVRFKYVMVDEYQDTNSAQYTLLRLLAGGHRNLAVVGDDDQSIYGFRGADVSNILNFERDFPDATVVRLEQNYRSSAHILTLANDVVAKNSGRLEKKLWTEAPPGPKVRFVEHQDARAEAEWVGKAIGKLRRMGHKWTDFAIIYRTNAMARPFETVLAKRRFPYRIVGGKKFYERREVRDALAYLRLVTNPANDAAFLRVVNVPSRGVGAKTVAKLREDASQRHQPLLRTARGRGAGKSKGEQGLAAFVDIIDELESLARSETPAHVLAHVLDKSGYRAMLEADAEAKSKSKTGKESKGRLENLEELSREASRSTPPPEALTPMEWLTAWLDQIALTATADQVPDEGEITLLTVHSSKGLEYPIVFVVQMNEGAFPHQRSLDTGIDEERRLAYVAFTRAQQRLLVTYTRVRQAHQGSGGWRPSRFLYGVPAEVIDGDLPVGDPAASVERMGTLSDPHRRTLAAMVDSLPSGEDDLPEEYTLVDLEEVEQLTAGARVLHAKWGAGTILRRAGRGVHVRFDRVGRRIVPLAGAPLQLIIG